MRAQEVGGDPARGLLMQLGKGQRARPVDGHEERQAAFFRLHRSHVAMEVAKRICLKLFLGWLVTCHFRAAADAMALVAAGRN